MKNEVFRESLNIAADLLVESLDGDAVEGGEVGIENDGLSAKADNGVLGREAERPVDARALSFRFACEHAES